jgi:hypothetical protein
VGSDRQREPGDEPSRAKAVLHDKGRSKFSATPDHTTAPFRVDVLSNCQLRQVGSLNLAHGPIE